MSVTVFIIVSIIFTVIWFAIWWKSIRAYHRGWRNVDSRRAFNKDTKDDRK